jgi:hypothetical protein
MEIMDKIKNIRKYGIIATGVEILKNIQPVSKQTCRVLQIRNSLIL